MRNRWVGVLLCVLAVHAGSRGLARDTRGTVGSNPADAVAKNPAKAGSHVLTANNPAEAGKDLEIYTERAYAISTGPEDVRIRLPGGLEQVRRPGRLPDDESDPVSYLLAVARGRVRPSGHSSLENNLIVTEILAAARESAKTGRRVVIDPRP